MYNKLVVALELSNDSEHILEQAMKLAGNDAGKVNLVHVIEPIPSTYGMESFDIDLNKVHKQSLDEARRNLIELGSKRNIGDARIYSVLGNPAKEIRKLAEELKADAIVIGSHGRSGWKMLLGATANKVLHGATCDILTVYVGKDKRKD